VAVDSVAISALGADPALGLVALSVEGEKGQQLLEGTDWLPPARFREPAIVFNFARPGDLLGWRTEGDAFSVAPVPSLFSVPTLNSLAKAGETATGRAISPDFLIRPEDTCLLIEHHGGNSATDDGPGALFIKLVDSATAELLYRLPASGSHVLREGRIPVARWRGRTVHLEAADSNTSPSYAWIGIAQVRLSAN